MSKSVSQSTAMAVIGSVAKMGTRAAASAAVGAGTSYFLLKRTDLVSIVGIELPHWAADTVLLAVSSAVGDMLSVTVLPWTERALGASPWVQNGINMTVGPVLCGATLGLGKTFLVSPASRDNKLYDFIMGLGVKAAGDRIVDIIAGPGIGI